MSSQTIGDCCIRGVVHEGTPTGEMKQFAGGESIPRATAPNIYQSPS
jgi:hypothetical protein